MTVTGFDAAVAKAHGYPAQRPSGVVYGNCGSSFIYIYNGNKDPYTGVNYGGRGYGYNTGYTVTGAVYDFEWHVKVTGPGWSKTDYDPGHPTGTRWTGHNHWATPYAGSYRGQVVPVAQAILENGSVCTSGDPADTVNVT